MNCRCALALVIASFSGPVIPTQAHATAKYAPSFRGDENRVILRTSELRSAYLLRAGTVRYDAADRSPQGLRRQLQRHFDVVLGLLFTSTPARIETALDRLESETSQVWSQHKRDAWRQQLLATRYRQMLRLAAYRDKGLFPINEGRLARPTPIFVDDQNTACAVGHLMRTTGWEYEVASISTENNLIYIPDIVAGPVAKWILTSGLTLEEAALIQPAYGPIQIVPPTPDDAINPLNSNWSGIAGDLRFSNFKLMQDSGGVETPNVNIPVSHCGPSFCFLTVLHPVPIFPELRLNTGELQSVEFEPAENVVESNAFANSSFLYPPSFLEADDFTRVVIQFDVETVSPSQRLSRHPFGSSLLVSPGQVLTYPRNDVSLFLSDDLTDLFFHHSEGESDHLFNNSVMFIGDESFKPVRRMTVVTEMLVIGGRPFEAQFLNFDVITIPEPNCVVLFALGCFVLAPRYRTKRLTI